jgi:hypothetical protein
LPGRDGYFFSGFAIHELGFALEIEALILGIAKMKNQYFMMAGTEVFQGFHDLLRFIQQITDQDDQAAFFYSTPLSDAME